ncbi:MAG: hypothetical protein HWN65_07475 [Candidatus Helarchaeota archaeon]|nr:hypothetical protein [Candidatus Helarchaeota archaeon]
MELKVTREYSDIVNLLEALEQNLETEIGIMQDEFGKKYSLDITKEILLYATNLVKMKLSFLLKDTLEEFKWFNIIIDCTEIDLNMNEVEALIRRVGRQMKDSIPEDSDPEAIQIIIKKYLRKLICKVPSKWTKPVVEEFLKQFEDTLSQLGVIIE